MNYLNNLLATGLVLDNHYLRLYCELVVEKALPNAIKFKTNCHHIIPRCFYKHLGILVDNSAANLVHLEHKNHLLAHYYLSLCTKDVIKWKCIAALTYIAGKYDLTTNNLDLYQQLVEESAKIKAREYPGHKHTADTKAKMSSSHTGVARTAYERECISKGWKNQTLEKKQQISKMNSERCKGRIYINNGEISKMIHPNDFEHFAAQGFVKGNLPKYNEKRVAACRAAAKERKVQNNESKRSND